MTPYNLVNMAKLLELDIIALTDHNTAGNCRAAIQAGKAAGIVVIPGMELCTSEEIHMVCLFPDIGSAEHFSAEIYKRLPRIKNRPEIFGEQLYMDSRDGELGSEEILLVTAADVTIGEAPALVKSCGGICYPAHIDRPSYSILASLGDFPPELRFSCAEITPAGDVDTLRAAHPALNQMRIMRSSDAHYLENMREASDTIELPERTAKAAVEYLKNLLRL